MEGLSIVDILFQAIHVLLLAAIMVLFLRADQSVRYGRRGYLLVKIGCLLILFSACLYLAHSLGWRGFYFLGHGGMGFPVIRGATTLLGAILLGAGLWQWLPTLRTIDLKQDLQEKNRKKIAQEFRDRTLVLKQEISRRKSAEERLRRLFEDAPVGIIHGVVGGSVVSRNQAFARMLGYDSPAQMAAQAARAGDPFLFWADRADAEEMFESSMEEGRMAEFQARFHHRNGSLRLFNLAMCTLEDRFEGRHFYTFAMDITPNATDGTMSLKELIRAIPTGIYVVDMETREVLDVNPAGLRITGYELHELVGTQCVQTLCRGEGEAHTETGDEQKTVQGKVARKDGSVVPVLKTSVRVPINGRDCMVESFVDISEHRHMEDLRRDMDRIVRHDLKSPIVSMISGCRVLLAEEKEIGGELHEILELMAGQGEKALKMLELSLNVYSMEAGRFEYTPKPVDLVAMAHRLCRDLAPTARSMGVDMETMLDQTPVSEDNTLSVPGHELLLESTITNLLLNGLEASPEGERVRLDLLSGDPVAIRVTNRGAVPGEIRETFFDKYVTAGKDHGTGLGTYAVYMAARAMGGQAHMTTSDEDDTTTVTVILPGR